MPASSLYCTQKSVSMISAAAANLSMAASPLSRLPLASSWAKTVELSRNRLEAIVAAPAAANPFFRNERRLEDRFEMFDCCIILAPFEFPLLCAIRLSSRGEFCKHDYLPYGCHKLIKNAADCAPKVEKRW